MSWRSWLPEGSYKLLGGLAASSVVAGVAVGAYLQLPDYLSEAAKSGELSYIDREDPGRAKWREVVSSLGGLGATYVVAANYTEPTPEPVFAAEVDRRFDDLVAEIETQTEAARREVSWRGDPTWSRRDEPQPELDDRQWGRPRAFDRSDDYERPAYPREARERPYAVGYGYGPRIYAGPPTAYDRPVEAPTAAYAEPDDEPMPPPPPRPSDW